MVSVSVRFSATVFNPEEKSYEDTLCTYDVLSVFLCRGDGKVIE